MENAIIISPVKETAFKNPGLVRATNELAECFNREVQSRKSACVILAKVERDKLYKDDGFKSLAEYAAKIGLDKSLAHKMENAGRAALSGDSTMRSFFEKADYSKLALLASEKEEDVVAALQSGEISTDSTASQIKDWKNSKKASKPEIVKKYHIQGAIYSIDGTVSMIDEDEEAPELYEPFSGFSWARIKPADATDTYYVGIHPNGAMARYTLDKPITKQAKRLDSMKTMQERLASMTDEEIAALLASIKANRG